MLNIKDKGKNLFIYLVPLLVAGLLKLIIYPPHITPFNADEAIVALMGRHILGGEAPLFFYGQSYMGSLDAILVSFGFRIFGQGVFVIRLVQGALYLGTVWSAMLLASRMLGTNRGIFYTGMIMAIPPINVSLYSTVSLGGYGELLLVGNLLLLGGLGIVNQIETIKEGKNWQLDLGLFFWGLGAGFSFWIIGLSLVYIIPMALVIFWKLFKKEPRKLVQGVLSCLAGGIIGSAPWWFDAFLRDDPGIIAELVGGAIRGTGKTPWLLKPLARLLNFFVFGGTVFLGLRPPWDIRWLMLPFLPFVLIFWLTVFIHVYQSLRLKGKQYGLMILAAMGFVLGIGFVFSPYGDDPSGRYFLPLITPMAIFGANFLTSQIIKKQYLEYGLLIMVLVFNLGGTIQSMLQNPPGITTQFDKVAQVDQNYIDELIEFLERNQVKTGYTNYWVSYPLAFLSYEELIFIPRLPYHEDFRYTARDDRYSPYREIVEQGAAPAYITTNHPALNQYLRDEFSTRGIRWEEEEIGDFQIFFNLSETIHVYDLGLGVTTTP